MTKDSKEYSVYDISLLKELLGDDICSEMLFLHAYTGCASTSKIFSVRKKSIFQNLVKRDPVLKSCANEFLLQNRSQDDISELGMSLMVHLFGGKSNQTLATMRNVIFNN